MAVTVFEVGIGDRLGQVGPGKHDAVARHDPDPHLDCVAMSAGQLMLKKAEPRRGCSMLVRAFGCPVP